MNANVSKIISFSRRALIFFHEQTGQSLLLWAFIALLSLTTQIVLRHELVSGEFGTFNTALGAIGLMAVPLLALIQAFAWYLALDHAPERRESIDAIRASALLVTEMFAWVWGGLSALLLLPTLTVLEMPRSPLLLFTLLNVLVVLGSLLSGAMCRSSGQLRLWAWLVGISALMRLLFSIGLGMLGPWAEAGLAAFFFAGLITFVPVLRPSSTEESQRLTALRAVWDRGFLLYLGATFSVLLAIFLFTNADRIVAQSWFGSPTDNNVGYVDWSMFDAYQTAGLLGRSLLWGTQPLLLLLFIQRSKLNRTTAGSLDWFWVYLGAMVTGVTLLDLFHEPLSRLFCGRDYLHTSHLIPILTTAMIPLGLLQGLGMFALASRRYPECFVLGGCGLGYLLLLFLVGRQPAIMPAYMFGGGLVSLMIVLLVGVVRWGRKQP
jgi:hypothetical protein